MLLMIIYDRSLRRETKIFSLFTELTGAGGVCAYVFCRLPSSVNYIDVMVAFFHFTVDLTHHNTGWKKYVKMFVISRVRSSASVLICSIYGSILSGFFKIKLDILSIPVGIHVRLSHKSTNKCVKCI